MKRKLFMGLIFTAAAIIITTGVLALLSGANTSKVLLTEKVDQKKPLVLHFQDCHVKLISLDTDEVRVKQAPLYGKEDAVLLYSDNTVTVLSGSSQYNKRDLVSFQSQTWIALLLFDKYFDYAHEVWDQRYVDFYVYVPKGMSVEAYTSGIMGSANGVDFESMNFDFD